MTSARTRAIFPSDARRKLCGKLIQQVPVGSLRREHSSGLHEFRYPDIEIRGRVPVDHQGRGEDREVNRPL
jgi:hypothetical protein